MNYQFQAQSFGGGELAMLLFHCLFMIVGLIGIVLLIVWMVKNLKEKQLLTWTIVFLVVGLLGSALTAGFAMNEMAKVFSVGGMHNFAGYAGSDDQYQQGMMGQYKTGLTQPALFNARHPGVSRMAEILQKADQNCTTANCDKNLEGVMENMMGEMNDYLSKNGSEGGSNTFPMGMMLTTQQ